MSMIFSIALDGPAGAGKSSVAKAVAKEMGAYYLDTGAMYRTMGLYMEKNGIEGAENVAAACMKPEIEVVFMEDGQHMLLDGEDVTDFIRTEAAGKLASKVSAVPEVRERLVDMQRRIAKGYSIVMDGRDIGTVVLPDATLKIFLTARPEVRAKRRYDDLVKKEPETRYEDVLAKIIQRDYDDSHRAASPMKQAEDAELVDTSDMTEREVVDCIIEKAKNAMEAKA